MKTLDEADLSKRDRDAALAAAGVLRSRLGALQVVLFGSAARGESGPESDIDLLVLMPGDGPVAPAERRRVAAELYPISLARGVWLSPVVVTESEWREGVYQAMSLRREIDRDGVPLLPLRAAA